MGETITGSAIQFGEIVVSMPPPHRHHHIFRQAEKFKIDLKTAKEQGFVTSTGRFVDREEALAIAKAAGQIIKKHGNDRILFSEDVW